MKYKGREIYSKICYNCRFLKLKGQMFSVDKYFCIKFDDFRNPYRFDSQGCTEFSKYRIPRKKKKAFKNALKKYEFDFLRDEYGNVIF